MSSGPERRFTVALKLALSLLLVACGSVGEPTTAGLEESPNSPTPFAGAVKSTSSCTPNVALGEPIAAPLPSFTCPAGWDARSKGSALLLSGRFTSAREMVDALCSQSAGSTSGGSTSDGEPAGIGIDIDFDVNDVIAVAHGGEVGLHRRAGELWIRQVESCDGDYRTSLFVVPKDVKPLEQSCSSVCE